MTRGWAYGNEAADGRVSHPEYHGVKRASCSISRFGVATLWCLQGTGRWSVGVKDGKIAFVGLEDQAVQAAKVIDATGKPVRGINSWLDEHKLPRIPDEAINRLLHENWHKVFPRLAQVWK
jgi:hypothetical protein